MPSTRRNWSGFRAFSEFHMVYVCLVVIVRLHYQFGIPNMGSQFALCEYGEPCAAQSHVPGRDGQDGQAMCFGPLAGGGWNRPGATPAGYTRTAPSGMAGSCPHHLETTPDHHPPGDPHTVGLPGSLLFRGRFCSGGTHLVDGVPARRWDPSRPSARV